MNVVGTGDPDVPARPDPAAGDAWVVEYVEPVSGNEAALGLDLVAETARREAIEEACRLNRPAATSPIRLVQDRSSATGFVVVAPVYQSDPAPMTPEARYEQCTGVMVVVYRASEVLSMVTAEEAAEFEVYDVGPLAAVAGSEPPRLDSLLFDTDGKSAAGGRPVNGTHPREEIDFHGRRWEILVTDVGSGRGGVASSVWAAAAFGVPFSALVSGLALQLAASRRRAPRPRATCRRGRFWIGGAWSAISTTVPSSGCWRPRSHCGVRTPRVRGADERDPPLASHQGRGVDRRPARAGHGGRSRRRDWDGPDG